MSHDVQNDANFSDDNKDGNSSSSHSFRLSTLTVAGTEPDNIDGATYRVLGRWEELKRLESLR